MGQMVSINISGFEGQIETLEGAGNEIQTGKYESYGMKENLPTCIKYEEQQREIIGLLKLYQQLIEKDAADLDEMKVKLTRLDQDIADQMKMAQ